MSKLRKTKTEEVNEDEVVYKLTPKGMLAILTKFDESAWDRLEKFVRDNSGCGPDEYPALVFKDGGICLAIKQDQLVLEEN